MRAAPLRRLFALLLTVLALLAFAAIAGLLWPPPADQARAQAGQAVPADWPLIPDGIEPGDSFHLLFVNSTTRGAPSTGVAFPLGNYHNGAEDGFIAADYIHRDDYLNGAALCTEAARQVPIRWDTAYSRGIR